MTPQSQSLYCQQAHRKHEACVVAVAGSALLPAFQLLSEVSPGCFLVAVGVPHLTLGYLLVEMYLGSGWPGPFCVFGCPGDIRPSSSCILYNMATVRWDGYRRSPSTRANQ